jgi:small subunit ribosomal protein S17
VSDEETTEETPIDETSVEETPAAETPAEDGPAAEAPAEEAPAAEAPVEEATAEEAPAAEAPVEEAPAEEAPAAEAPVEEAPAEEAPVAEAPVEVVEDAEPEEKLTSKQARKRTRGAHSGDAGPARTNEERAAARDELRKAKAASRRRWRDKQRAKKAATGVVGEPTPAKERVPGNPKIRQGLVVSDKGEKTITVRIDVARRHPKYEKIVRSSSTVRVHDESNDANEGDTVRVIECRPLSATKRWRLDEVVERAR